MNIEKADELRNSKEFRYFTSMSLWNTTVDKALADMNGFLVHLMAKTPDGFFDYVKEEFNLTNDDFVEALREAPPGEFIYEDNWLEWNEKLGISPPLPFPVKYPPFIPPDGAESQL